MSAHGSVGASPPLGVPRAAERQIDRLAALVFAALVAASFAAFAVTQHLKHTPTAVQNFKLAPYFSPAPGGRHRLEHLSFRIRQADDVTVAIVDSSDSAVATLVRDRPLARYRQLSLTWDGRRGPTRRVVPGAGTSRDPLAAVDRGPRAPAGEYRVRVSLRRQHRTLFSPRSFTLVLEPRR